MTNSRRVILTGLTVLAGVVGRAGETIDVQADLGNVAYTRVRPGLLGGKCGSKWKAELLPLEGFRLYSGPVQSAANTAGTLAESSADVVHCRESLVAWSSSDGWSYCGRIYAPRDCVLNLGGAFADYHQYSLDGTVVRLWTGDFSTVVITSVRVTRGWHDVEFRLKSVSGKAGANWRENSETDGASVLNTPPTIAATRYSFTDEPDTSKNSARYAYPEDDGTADFLRSPCAETAAFSVQSVVTEGGAVRARLEFAATRGSVAEVSVCFGAADLGDNGTAYGENCVRLGTVAAGATSAVFDLPEGVRQAAFIRFRVVYPSAEWAERRVDWSSAIPVVQRTDPTPPQPGDSRRALRILFYN